MSIPEDGWLDVMLLVFVPPETTRTLVSLSFWGSFIFLGEFALPSYGFVAIDFPQKREKSLNIALFTEKE